MLNFEQREALVREALTWKGTPYRGWSCLKGCGVDCGQLLYGIYRACGLVPEIALPTDYSLEVAQHRASTEYIDVVWSFFREIPEAEVLPGDVVIYKLGHAFAHGAFIVRWPDFILQAEARHGVSGSHGVKNPAFHNKERCFGTIRDGAL